MKLSLLGPLEKKTYIDFDNLSTGIAKTCIKHKVYLNNAGQACHVDALAHVPVLEESLLGHMGLLEVHAELQILVHDLLDELLAVVVIALLRLDDIVESVKRSGRFTCIKKVPITY